MQRKRGPLQRNEKNYSQVGVTEAPKEIQEEYPKINFIPALQSDRSTAFEASLLILNAFVEMS